MWRKNEEKEWKKSHSKKDKVVVKDMEMIVGMGEIMKLEVMDFDEVWEKDRKKKESS